MSLFTTLVAAASLASLAQGHMILRTPAPFNFTVNSQSALGNNGPNSSPLDANGDNFPCKLTSSMVFDTANSVTTSMELGSSQPLDFYGSAVHGGGSCQISLTTDQVPTAKSTWKVIYSIEGGCPARGETGNLVSNAAGVDPYAYTFKIPSDIPSGKYTLAWTWFNKIGNREMYMNCAAVSLTGTSTGSTSNFNALPDMFKANIGNGCGTQDSMDVLFPQPGANVVSMNTGTTAFATPTGTGCQASSAAAATTAAGTAGNAGNAAASSSTTTSLSGGVFFTQNTGTATATGAAGAATTTKATTTVTSQTTLVTSAKPAGTTAKASGTSSASSSTSTSTAGALTGACTTEGMWNCIGGTSYQQCASGQWSVVMSLAAGTKCTSGTSNSIAISAIAAMKRRAIQWFS